VRSLSKRPELPPGLPESFCVTTHNKKCSAKEGNQPIHPRCKFTDRAVAGSYGTFTFATLEGTLSFPSASTLSTM
jgi:hypothetical protein